jgi:hypothetical protein
MIFLFFPFFVFFTFIASSAFSTSLKIEALKRITRPSIATRLPILRVLRVLSIVSFSRNYLCRSVASVFRSSAKIRSSRIKSLLRGLRTLRDITSSTRSLNGIIGGVLSRGRSLEIRSTSSRRLEFSSSYSIVSYGVSRVERITSGSRYRTS